MMKPIYRRVGFRYTRWAATSLWVILLLTNLPSVRAKSFDELVRTMNDAFISEWSSESTENKEFHGKKHVNGMVELDRSAGRLTIRFEPQPGELMPYRAVSLVLKDIDITSVDARANSVTDIRKTTFFASTKGGQKTIEIIDGKTGEKKMESSFAFASLLLGDDNGFLEAFRGLVEAYSR